MDWFNKNVDARNVKIRYKFDPSLSPVEKKLVQHNGMEWAKAQCEEERKVYHQCRDENMWTAIYYCRDAVQQVNFCVASKLTQEAIREFELDVIRNREQKEKRQKMMEVESLLDREFVDFAHKFREHKASLKDNKESQSK